MPEANLKRFTSPPTQIDDAAFAQTRKVDQASADVAHDDAHALDALDHQPQLAGKRATPGFVHFAGRLEVHAAIGPWLPLRGLGSYLNSADGSLAQLDRARALGALGVALYSYAVPSRDLEGATQDDRQAFAAQLRAVFGRPAPVPHLPPPLAVSR